MQKIAGVSRRYFLKVVEEVTKRFIALPENPKPERTGGYVAVLEKKNRKMLLITEVGICSPDMLRCINIVQEKVQRLFGYLIRGHFSSWQSRDFKNQKYGGGITTPPNSMGTEKGKDIIGAISGFVEYGDEAVILVTWMVFRWVTLGEAKEIVAISSNNLFEPLLNVCNDLFDWDITIVD